jgi:hypothetical protein
MYTLHQSGLPKGKPNIIVWTKVEEDAFDELKPALRNCVKANLYIAEWGHSESTATVRKSLLYSCLRSRKTHFFRKFQVVGSSSTTCVGSESQAIEKEAYAIIWSLNKFRTWIFGAPVTIFADSNYLLI